MRPLRRLVGAAKVWSALLAAVCSGTRRLPGGETEEPNGKTMKRQNVVWHVLAVIALTSSWTCAAAAGELEDLQAQWWQ
jgi:hypothetical protein